MVSKKREKNKGKEKKRKCSPSSQCLLKPSLEKEALLSQPKWWVVRSSRPNSEVVLRNGVNEVKIPFKTRQRGGDTIALPLDQASSGYTTKWNMTVLLPQ